MQQLWAAEHFTIPVISGVLLAVIMGSESTGLSDPWLKKADFLIKIPMGGKIDSMNVSVSAAI